ncbi:MAG TPA: hypothetical protein VIC84_23700 [Blastocatellia bacterium]|jgi:hypothetical protein
MNFLEAEIIRCLCLAPHSFAELVNGLPKQKPAEIRKALNALRLAGQIMQLDSGREGGPFYALPGYVEETRKRDHSDQRLHRNYGGRIYASPAWTDDV